MFLYLEYLILRLSDMLSIDSDMVSEFSFANSSFTGILVDGVRTEWFYKVMNTFTIKSFATNIIMKTLKKAFYMI